MKSKPTDPVRPHVSDGNTADHINRMRREDVIRSLGLTLEQAEDVSTDDLRRQLRTNRCVHRPEFAFMGD